jgi:hypothetical protein
MRHLPNFDRCSVKKKTGSFPPGTGPLHRQRKSEKKDVNQGKQPFRWNVIRNVAQEILFPQANLHFTKAAEPVGAAAGETAITTHFQHWDVYRTRKLDSGTGVVKHLAETGCSKTVRCKARKTEERGVYGNTSSDEVCSATQQMGVFEQPAAYS